MSVNGQKIIAAVWETAGKQPDRVFTGLCVYVYKDGPECLVGHGLWDVGLIDSSFGGNPRNHLTIREIGWVFELDDDETAWLQAVQDQQDTSHDWGRCVYWADRHAPLPAVLLR